MNNRKLLYLASNPTEASLIASFLEGNSIRADLEHLTVASILPIGGSFSVKIFVFSSQWERALGLLKIFLKQETRDN
ncbi:MAG: hypothetical protein CMP53_08125 [Flavobacteriales bacterium]|nr:hypothetical protein [Flavobacteriales bacterium]